ncbi:MAG: PilZ domain-containing protein [Hyphomicrobiaceae bacterium]
MPNNTECGRERRQDDRRKSVRAAISRFEGARSPIQCVLLDISLGGARLYVHDTSEVPDQFQLHVESEALTRQCEVVWRQTHELGVKFI